MQAIILLGGKGTRLQSLYPDRPKALVPIAGRPFIEWQLGWLQKGGVRCTPPFCSKENPVNEE